MKYLVFATILWAFSFSLIGEFLVVDIDSYFAVFLRVLFAFLVFLPFMKFANISNILKMKVFFIGAIQIGLMYIFLYKSFLYLSVPEVVLFTIFTPIYVTLIYDAFICHFKALYLLSASIAVLGAFIIRYEGISSDFLVGFLLVQGANFSFAFGQSAYKKLFKKYNNMEQKNLFAYFYLGALIFSFFAFVAFGDFSKISPNLTQWLVLLWLGIVASGVGYFLWNKGATMVDSGVLAIMNNALVPAGLIVNLIIWQKPVDYLALIIGSLIIIFALYLHERFRKMYKFIYGEKM